MPDAPEPDALPAVWVVDTSPFIGLAKVGQSDLLSALTRRVWIADVVEREVLAGPRDDPAREALSRSWVLRVPTPRVPTRLAAMRLDAGEAAVLAVALSRPRSVAVMDDSAGRAAAKALGVSAVGTVGVLLQAKQEGRLAQIAPVLSDLQRVGLFLPRESLLTTLLASVGEAWP